MKIGYARVSTDDQNLNLQMDALNKAGCERTFTDQESVGPPSSVKGYPEQLPRLVKVTCWWYGSWIAWVDH